MTDPHPVDAQAIDLRGLAQMLNISTDTAGLLAIDGTVPSFRVGRLWRFWPDLVRAALDARSDPWQRSSHSAAGRRTR
ncbi:MAG: hypothetical protein IT189_00025 [Microbacteriaceae bacterium]|nr:hypothetical protein [Microbacteriaceae bacterium]